MHKSLSALVFVGVIAAAGTASAADIEGTIARTDDVNRMVLLDNGEKYLVSKDIDTSQLDWGTSYEISLTMIDGQPVATHFQENSNKEDAN
jgi:outer membrane lipoprotein SlyB